MEQCLIAVYGETVGKQATEAMMILIAGTFICNYNGVLTGGINHNIIGYLSNLAKSQKMAKPIAAEQKQRLAALLSALSLL